MQGKTNPDCLCGMIPPVESYRKEGLWARGAEKNSNSCLKDADPSLHKRSSLLHPVGLCNLGNTCYVNSVLQCLFAVREFRNCILSASSPALQDSEVVQNLRWVVSLVWVAGRERGEGRGVDCEYTTVAAAAAIPVVVILVIIHDALCVLQLSCNCICDEPIDTAAVGPFLLKCSKDRSKKWIQVN